MASNLKPITAVEQAGMSMKFRKVRYKYIDSVDGLS